METIMGNYKEQELRSLIYNSDNNCWKRENKDGSITFFSKDYYNSDFNSKKDDILSEIEKEIKKS